MLWFRYRWLLIFSHGLCVKIVRASNQAKALAMQLDRVQDHHSFNRAYKVLEELIESLDEIIFSSTALIFREYKGLVTLRKSLTLSVRKIHQRYEKDERVQAKKSRELGEHAKEMSKRDRHKEPDYHHLLDVIAEIVEDVEGEKNEMYLEAKAAERHVLSIQSIKEMSFRKRQRLAKKVGINAKEVDQLRKRVVKHSQSLKESIKIKDVENRDKALSVEELEKYAEWEAEDITEMFRLAMQITHKTEEFMEELQHKLKELPGAKPGTMTGIKRKYARVKKDLETLEGDITNQTRRLKSER